MAAPSLIDWGALDDDNDDDDDEVPEVVVVPSSPSANTTTTTSISISTSTPTSAVTPDLAAMSDRHLREKIQWMRDLLNGTTARLSDGGDKFRSSLAQCQDELRPRLNTPCVGATQEKSPFSHSTPRLYKCSDRNFFPKKRCASLSVNNFYGKENVAFGSDLFVLGRDKCKISEQGKRLQASRELPFRSFSDKCHRREKDKEQNCSKKVPFRSISDRIHSQVNSSGYKDLSAHLFSKRRKVPRTEDPLDSDSAKVTEMILLDDDDIETPEHASNKEIPEEGKETKIYYPSRNDPEAIELGYSDVKCLKTCEYLSSPVMNFYIQFLKQSHCQTSSLVQNFYIFNTYFYQKLKEALDGKDEQNSLYTKLRRWWKNVNIFEKAYIILPIHGSLHWSLVIICIPEEESQSGPIILHLDSLGCHPSSLIFSTIERYLKKEWDHVAQSNFQSSLLQIQKEKVLVPQQKNEYDCGLFALYFIERFIIDAPDRFTNDDLSMFSRKWFKPEEASSLRKRISCLLFDEFDVVQMEEGTKDLQTVCSSSDCD